MFYRGLESPRPRAAMLIRFHSLLVSLAIGAAGAALSLGLWHTLAAQQDRSLRDMLGSEARLFAEVLENEADSLERTLLRSANWWRTLNGTPQAAWHSDARAIIDDYPFITFLRWVDADYHIRWEAGASGSVIETDTPQNLNPEALARMNGAREAGQVYVSSLFRDENGLPYVICYVPVFAGGAFDGFILARLALQPLLQGIYDRTAVTAHLLAAAGETPLYEGGLPMAGTGAQYQGNALAASGAFSMQITALPSAAFLRDNRSPVPQLVLAFSLLLSLIAAIAVHQSLRARTTSRALQQSEQHLRLMVESVDDYAILMLDPDGNIASWNTGAERMKGYTADEIIGRHFSVFYPEEEREKKYPEQILETARREGRFTEEGRRVRKNGSLFWANVLITALRDRGGNLYGFGKVTRDVTRRRNAAEALRQSEEKFRTLFQNNPQPMWISDQETLHFLEVNDAAVEVFGYSREEFLKMTIMELRPAENMSKLLKSVASRKPGFKETKRDRLRRRDGWVLDFELRTHDIELFGRRVTLVAALDVTQRLKAERESLESQRIYGDIFDNSDAAIVDDDLTELFSFVQELKATGVKNLREYIAQDQKRLLDLAGLARINAMNPGALRLFGAASVEEARKADYFRKGNRPLQILAIAEAIFDGKTRLRGEAEYLTSSGTRVPIIWSMRVPQNLHEARRAPIVIFDMSDIKLAEAARQASVAKSQFLASMSHEIRTPLNGVIGNIELLAQANLTSDQFELLSNADKAAKSLLALIGNILDFSKIEAGKLSIEMGEINPAGLVEEAVDVLQSRARQKGIFITAAFGPDVPQMVRGDRTRIRQVLLNLIGNAVKFTAEGGVHVQLTVTAWDQDVCELTFEVHDSGCGFDHALAERLFEPFTQDRTPAATEGTGLGLSICRSLVEAFGGTIDCDSIPGEGASFRFRLPVAVIKSAPAVARPGMTGKTILIVGSNADKATRPKDYFAARGADVAVAYKETEAIALLDRKVGEGRPPEAALLAPAADSDGVQETVDRLRQKHIVPLLFTAEDSFSAQRRALRQGFAAIIPPTVSEEHLDRNIRLLIGHAPTRDRRAEARKAVLSGLDGKLRGKRVLVLEDRLINQTVIQKQLNQFGIDCTLAVNGLKGLEEIRRQDFDLILCDCSMPEMNGYEFTRALRKIEAAKDGARRMPVVALTANAFREDAEKCLDAGMDDFISKPVTLDRLASALTKWMTPHVKDSPASAPASRTADGGAAIDLNALSEILGTPDAAVISEVLGEYLATAGESQLKVKAAIMSGDAAAVAAAAHGAKGEALSAAARPLGQIYAEIEHAAKSADTAAMTELASRAAAELTRIEGFIENALSKGGT